MITLSILKELITFFRQDIWINILSRYEGSDKLIVKKNRLIQFETVSKMQQEKGCLTVSL
jgi:hypothetical protein